MSDSKQSIEERLVEAFHWDDEEKIENLLSEKRLNVNYVNENKKDYKDSLLTLAIKQGNAKTVEVLLKRGANPNFYEGEALHQAVREGRKDLLELLIQYSGKAPKFRDVLLLTAT